MPYLLVALILLQTISGPNQVLGAYTTSSLDADGNDHLGSNTVNKTALYDTSKDSSAATRQQLGVDPNWQNGVTRESYGVKFDGVDDRITVPSSSLFNYGTGNFTIETWVKFNSTARYYLMDTSLNGGSLIITPGTGYVEAYSGGPIINAGSTPFNLGQWYHIALVRSGSTFTVYRNGVSYVSSACQLASPPVR